MEDKEKPNLNTLLKRHKPRRAKTPTLLQMEAVECGAAALGIILGYYQKFVPLEELRLTCGVSRDGSKAANVLRAGRKYGLKATGYRKSLEKLLESPVPCIIYWGFNHFLVFEGFRNGKIYLNDPAVGPRKVDPEEFNRSYTGLALYFEPTGKFQRGGKKSTLLDSLKERFKGSEVALTFVVLVGLFLVIPGLLVPVFSKVFVDRILVGHLEEWLRPLLACMGATLVIQAVLTWLQEYYLLRYETKLALSSSAKFFWHVLRLPVEFFGQRMAGDIGDRVQSSDRVARLLSGELAAAVLSTIVIIFYAALMFSYDVVLTLVGIVAVVLNVAALKMVARVRADKTTHLMQENAKLFGVSQGGLASIETIKANGAENDYFARVSGHVAKVVNAQQTLAIPTTFVNEIPMLLQALTNFAILGIGGFRVMDGQMTMGMLIAFQVLMSSFIAPVQQLVRLGSSLQDVTADMKRLDDVFRYKREDQLDAEAKALTSSSGNGHPAAGASIPAALPPPLRGQVSIRSVSFGYNQLEKPLVRDFELELPPGSRVALVGGSGSGKSTMAKLIMGLYKPWGGQILFDGEPRQSYDKGFLAQNVAMVDQDIFLFEGTVRENLSMWDPNIPEERILQAARDAEIHDIIAARPGGYDGRVEEGGGNFSGGQRQRLEIARALVNDPAILVLDEATSALDPVTEKKIDANLRRRGCTCIIVAHRLSTIRDADEIIVMRFGKIVERGQHDGLVETGGPYAELIKH